MSETIADQISAVLRRHPDGVSVRQLIGSLVSPNCTYSQAQQHFQAALRWRGNKSRMGSTPLCSHEAGMSVEQRRDDEAVEGALRHFLAHPEDRTEGLLEWRHIEVLIRQIDRLRQEADDAIFDMKNERC